MERPTGRTPPRGDCPSSPKGGQRCDSPWPGANALVPPPRAHAGTPPGTPHHAALPTRPPRTPETRGGHRPPTRERQAGEGRDRGGPGGQGKASKKGEEAQHGTHDRTTAPRKVGKRPGGKQGTDAGRWAPPPRSTGAAANGRGSGGECPLSRQRRQPGDIGKPTTRDGPPRGGPLPAPLGPCSRGCARKAPSPEGRASLRR